MAIFALPHEILAVILSFLDPQSIIRFGRTCKTAYASTGPQNQILWKSAFLHVFDDPDEAWSMTPGTPPSTNERGFDFHTELSKRFIALQAVRTRSCGSNDRAEAYIEALLSILDTAKFTPNARDIANGKVPIEDDRYTSLNLQILSNLAEWREGIESLIYDTPSREFSPRPITRSMTVRESERCRTSRASRLHVMYGLTNWERVEHKARGAARRKVYDWTLIGADNDYAPFLRDGSGKVDWPLLEGVATVMRLNFSKCVDQIAAPEGFCYSLPHRTLVDPTTPEDWARATGPWLGTYAFLDYADLWTYNNWEGQAEPRMTLDGEPEDCGDLMRLTLKLDPSISSDPRLQTKLPISTDLPVLYFSGHSRGYNGMRRLIIAVRGFACLVPGSREVRWRFLINYGGQDHWLLEGIQPGGVRSGGIFGIWTHCDHEVNTPSGPFCYFPEELCKSTSVVVAAR
ncbi:hypothetical protein G647_05848 [Cladophialophora carrionii CBS 160.54]|uniref:F-box domain-containing protein n=1 Tax=Cladophialophora carrionii CBS 160.54 TaxID=1279043 RepID=V9D4E6_9EURO|nr:uncharacterized protein G647_05848 [Cladophialophora carrionii CBS 160.54]ETI21779.1 hypothetical protein G647_05848 [Cladophialophora carrionii CBS 160.54]